MKLAIMQPYFMPYIGYFQLLNAVDKYIVYDNIKYTKKGWINRNRILKNGEDSYISLPLEKGSDSLDIVKRSISQSFDRKKLLNQIKESYRRSPYFNTVYPVIQEIINYDCQNLFHYLFNQLEILKEYMEIDTEIIVSSDININHNLKSEDKVLALCKASQADVYINAIGGIELYSHEVFQQNGLELFFIKTNDIRYEQFANEFVPWLSVIDVLMFNSPEAINSMLSNYELI